LDKTYDGQHQVGKFVLMDWKRGRDKSDWSIIIDCRLISSCCMISKCLGYWKAALCIYLLLCCDCNEFVANVLSKGKHDSNVVTLKS
jgi:hypothetical protein